MAHVLVLRSTDNPLLLNDLHEAMPHIHWIDIPMPYLPGRGETDAERKQLLETVGSLIAPYRQWDAVFYARAYGAFSAEGRAALSARVGGPVITAPGAVLQYFSAQDWQRIFVLTPYGQARHDFEVQWVTEQGLAVVASACLGYDAGQDIAQLTPEDLVPGITTGSRTPADGIYVACTITRTVHYGMALHRTGHRPVISATEAMLKALQEQLS